MIAGGFHAYINEEYKNVDTSEELTSVSLLLPNEDLHSGYNRIPGGSSAERKSFLKSFRKAIWASNKHGILSVSSYGICNNISLCRFKHN